MPDDTMRSEIEQLIHTLMENVLQKVLYDDPFLPEKHHAAKPLYAALVPDEIFKSAHFERRFVTPFRGILPSPITPISSVRLTPGRIPNAGSTCSAIPSF